MHPVAPATDRASTAVSVFSVLVAVWTLAVSIAVVTAGQIVFEAASLAETFPPDWFAPANAVFGAALSLPPAVALVMLARRRPRNPGSLATGWMVMLTVSAAAVLGCVRAAPLPQNEVLLGLSAVVAAAAGWGVRRLRSPVPAPPAAEGEPSGAPFWEYLVGLGLLMLTPWVADGALGGVAETILAVLLAVAVGYLVTGIVTDDVLAAYARSRPRMVVVGGLATGVALAPVAAALGGPGVNVAELITVPALGLSIAAVAAKRRMHPEPAGGSRRRRNGLGALVALAVVGPVAFVDPEETSIVLGSGDVGTWTTYATVTGLVIALGVGVAYAVALRPRLHPPRPAIPATVAVVALVACGAFYVGAGHPGFYGERLFVVMAQQADLTGVNAIADIDQRRRETYDRLVRTAQESQAGLRHELDQLHIAYTPYYLVNGILVDAGPALRPILSARSDVDRVLFDQRLRPLPEPAPDVVGPDPAPPVHGPSQWNIRAIGATNVWADGDTGQGITIGTSDTGVDGDHPLLVGNYRGNGDSWYDPWNGTRRPTDHMGHGTHTIGTAVGQDGIGVAPGAQWMACVNLDRDYGSPSGYLDCLQFMLAPFPYGGNPMRDGRPERAADILTNSWGCPPVEGCDPDALRPATAALAAAGIYDVVAAGNSGPDCGSVADPPAPYSDVLTVGATRPSGDVARFSSRGPTADHLDKPDLVAPGVDILSALPQSTYGRFSGTSMAAPHVAGVVALMWSANPKLIGDIAGTTRILLETATPLSGPDVGACGTARDTTGAGLVNAYDAVQAARQAS